MSQQEERSVTNFIVYFVGTLLTTYLLGCTKPFRAAVTRSRNLHPVAYGSSKEGCEIMWVFISFLYRAYYRARLAEMRKSSLAS